MKFPSAIPFVETLGFELHRFEDGTAELQVDLADAHLNSWQVAHGGVLMTLLDVAMAHAARSIHAHETDRGPGVVTVEMKTSFMRPAEGRLRALGKLLHRSTTMAFCEGSIFDPDGHLCAHATGTFKYLRKLPTKGRDMKSLRTPKES
ncbi:MAG: PaaI family thioesterase [Pseudomonadota bacterium]